MTVLTDDGSEYLDDYFYGRESDPIDTIAVGTGDDPESYENSELSNEVYRSNVDNENVRFPPVPGMDSSTYASIDIRGGLEVPADSEITEIGVFIGNQDVLVFRDVRSSVTVENGVEVTLRLRIDLEEL